MLLRPNTEKIYAELCLITPGGVNSPVRSFQAVDLTPLIVQKGSADQIWDIDGHTWIDFCMSWGALILGHAPANVVSAATRQIACGSSFGITTVHENQLATEIVSCMPSIQKMRFVSSGTEAVMSAIRLSRGYTARDKIIKFNGHYHGHSDSLLVQAGSGILQMPSAASLGVPQEVISHTISLPFNDIETCRCFLQKTANIAAVIVEPIAANMGLIPAKKEFLAMLREETQKKQIVLIFDEVVSGFRIGLEGAQGYYGIEPDLTCLGKIIGGGFPAAAFGGKKEIMDCLAPLGSVYQAGTLSGNPVAMCAGLETLLTLKAPTYSYLEKITQDFLSPIKEVIAKRGLPITLQHIGSMFNFFFGVTQVEKQEDLKNLNTQEFKRFFQHLFHHGVYLSPSAYEVNFLSLGHTQKNLEKTQQVILDYLHAC